MHDNIENSSPLEDKINALLQKNKISFPCDLESDFRTYYYNKTLKTTRIALLLGMILFAIFGILDHFLAPLSSPYMWSIRFGFVIPIYMIALVFSYFSLFKRAMQLIIGLVSLSAGLGIVAMIAIAANVETSLYYYAGLILVIMWSYAFVGLRFVNASVICWSILIGYEITAVCLQGVLGSQTLLQTFVSNNFFFISSNIIGMFTCFMIEIQNRKDFLQRLLITEKQKILEVEKEGLKDINESFMKELGMARKIQMQLIPTRQPNDNIAFLYKPYEPVGGDFFDFIKFREQTNLGIFLSDVSGHGVPAAFITAMVKSSILESRSYKEDPKQLLLHLNNLFFDKIGDHFITAFYCIYETENRIIRFANAGHTHPFVIRGDKVEQFILEGSLPIGFVANGELKNFNGDFTQGELRLDAGDRIILYTDGLVEARCLSDTSKFFLDDIASVFLKHRRLSARQFLEDVFNDLVRFRGSDRFDDDICVVCVDVT
jgi:serine phosphatase RsbU (regulator of sigma subunit)